MMKIFSSMCHVTEETESKDWAALAQIKSISWIGSLLIRKFSKICQGRKHAELIQEEVL